MNTQHHLVGCYSPVYGFNVCREKGAYWLPMNEQEDADCKRIISPKYQLLITLYNQGPEAASRHFIALERAGTWNLHNVSERVVAVGKKYIVEFADQFLRAMTIHQRLATVGQLSCAETRALCANHSITIAIEEGHTKESLHIFFAFFETGIWTPHDASSNEQIQQIFFDSTTQSLAAVRRVTPQQIISSYRLDYLQEALHQFFSLQKAEPTSETRHDKNYRIEKWRERSTSLSLPRELRTALSHLSQRLAGRNPSIPIQAASPNRSAYAFTPITSPPITSMQMPERDSGQTSCAARSSSNLY